MAVWSSSPLTVSATATGRATWTVAAPPPAAVPASATKSTKPNGVLRPACGVPVAAEVATALAATKAFVGHDSGITHMAAALGRRCVVLWGKTNESIWRPRSERARILRSGSSWNTLSVDTVFNALREEVAAEAAG